MRHKCFRFFFYLRVNFIDLPEIVGKIAAFTCISLWRQFRNVVDNRCRRQDKKITSRFHNIQPAPQQITATNHQFIQDKKYIIIYLNLYALIVLRALTNQIQDLICKDRDLHAFISVWFYLIKSRSEGNPSAGFDCPLLWIEASLLYPG